MSEITPIEHAFVDTKAPRKSKTYLRVLIVIFVVLSVIVAVFVIKKEWCFRVFSAFLPDDSRIISIEKRLTLNEETAKLFPDKKQRESLENFMNQYVADYNVFVRLLDKDWKIMPNTLAETFTPSDHLFLNMYDMGYSNPNQQEVFEALLISKSVSRSIMTDCATGVYQKNPYIFTEQAVTAIRSVIESNLRYFQ